MKKHQKNSSHVTFRANPNLVREIDDHAEKFGMARSRFIREALIEWLDHVHNEIDNPVSYLITDK